MSAQIVVDISSDEEDHAAKSSNRTRSIGKQSTGSPRTAVKSPFRTSPIVDKPAISPPVMANRPDGPTNTEPRSQSADTSPLQIEQEALNNRLVSAPQTAGSVSIFPTSTSTTSIAQEPPKPTPLNINEFRHLVAAGSVPAKDSPLIMSIQPVTTAASNKRKAPDAPESNPSRRPRPAPLPQTPYTGTSEHPVPPRSGNSLLWSVPAYKPPPPPPPPPPPGSPASSKQPSIPNIHVPIAATLPTTTATTSTSSSSSVTQPQTPTPPSKPTPTPPTPKPRQRESKWTGAQLANLASALESAFLPTAAAFAAENKKTVRQVRETFSFLVGRRIFEFSDEAGGSGAAAADSGGNGGNGGGKGGSIGGNGGNGGGNGGGGNGVEGIGKGKGMGNEGRGRAKTVVARRFEKEFREHRRMSEKTMRMVHGKEAREGHWACEGMGGKGGRGRGRKKEGRGVLGGLVGEV